MHMRLLKTVVLLISVLPYANVAAQKVTPATAAETPEHFMRGVLQLANTGDRGLEVLDMSESIYTLGFLDAMYGNGCFTEHQPCIADHLIWAKICGCRYFPEDVEKKGDPLCGCPARLTFSKLSVDRANTNSAEVSALLNLEPHKKDKVTWHLIMTPQGWRIDDIATSDFPSLKARESR